MPQQTKSQGFGDDFEKIAKLLRADKLAKKIAGALGKEDCGCTKRKETLNRLFPYNKEQNNEPG